MKKYIAVMLALTMVLATSACGTAIEKPAGPAPSESIPAENELSENESTESDSAENEATEDTPIGATIANPIREYSSLEEINSATGGSLCRPGVMGVTEVRWAVLDMGTVKMAEFDFEVNGLGYRFRFAPTAEDISGVWIGENTAFPEDCGEDIQYAETEDMKLARWMNEDGQYVLMLTDKGSMSSDSFEPIAEELRSKTRGEF